MNLTDIIKHPHLPVFITTALLIKIAGLYTLIYLLSHTPRKPYPEELQYITTDGKGGIKRGKLPNVEDSAKDTDDDIELSVVIPSYNETSRILVMLMDAINFLQEHFKDKWEILIVDDGSTDATSEFCLKLSHEKFNLKPDQLRIIKFVENRGKGGAVKHGMLHIRGKYGLFADADGASKFSDVSKLLNEIKSIESDKTKTNDKTGDNLKIPSIVIGSRAHMVNTEAVIKRSLIRNCLMYGFHALVFLFGIRSIKDTQCGFKLFNKQAINDIFPYLRTEGWIFDVEILILGLKKKMQISEIPISWHEVDGSKMNLKLDSLMMAKDLIIIRLSYMLGIYKAYSKV